MTQISWSPEMATGANALDELHRDIFQTLAGLQSIADSKFEPCYEALVKKMECAFAIEDQWMEEIDFPVLKTHREQHARVLGALHSIHAKVMNGDFAAGRQIGELLPQWLSFHISTMDAALAMAMQITGTQQTSPANSRTAMAYAG